MSKAIFRAENVTKSYPGTTALKDIDFSAYEASVNILIGENGAGKSTLMKIIAGAEKPTSGKLFFDGKEVSFNNASEAAAQGIGIIYQELDLCLNLSITDNIFLGHENSSYGGIIHAKEQEKIARELLARLNCDISPHLIVGDLSVSVQQLVAIAKALRYDTKILIMDEPTSALSTEEVKTLFKVIQDLKARGVAIIYISHRLDELLEIGDHVTVLRDGHIVGHDKMQNIDLKWILHCMLGETRLDVPHHNATAGESLLKVKDLYCPRTAKGVSVNGVSLEVRSGEIVGLFGLMGAGRTELLESLIGLHPQATGEIDFLGKKVKNSLSLSERIGLGMAMVPEDRQASGIVQSMSVRENITLANLSRYSKMGFLPYNYGADDVAGMIKNIAIKIYSPSQMITTLSGGNQQKTIVSKAMLTRPRLLLMDEPGRGIDVKAKAEIFTLMNKLASEGIGILFVSSELMEIMALSDRTLVMSDGRITAEFTRGSYNEQDLMVNAARFREARQQKIEPGLNNE